VDTTKKDISIIPFLFPGSVGLSNPLSNKKQQQQQQQQQISESDIKRKISNDNITKRSARPHGTVIESTVLQSVINPGVTKPQVFTNTAEIVRIASFEMHKILSSLATLFVVKFLCVRI
jgi:hypothetical protein